MWLTPSRTDSINSAHQLLTRRVRAVTRVFNKNPKYLVVRHPLSLGVNLFIPPELYVNLKT